ncbi:hypothetical protein FQR65_LT19628 [Abscondita terminalis]|nr:hypothetical protein FQR65_LT19628 [Abscondita terminalis]
MKYSEYHKNYPTEKILENFQSTDSWIDELICELAWLADTKFLKNIFGLLNEENISFKFQPTHNPRHDEILTWLNQNISRRRQSRISTRNHFLNPNSRQHLNRGRILILLRALYEVGPSTSQNRLPTPPPTTPPLQHPEPEVSSEVTDPVEGLFLGLGKIQNNYEERLNSLYVDLKSAGVELVENILEMDKERKVAVEKLEQIYANISDVRAALKNIREQKK